jgi:GrxC family glutaredoxin
MNKLFLLLLAIIISSCSGIAPEAMRDDTNPLLKPPFLKATTKPQQKLKATVEIYSKTTCPYCVKAKALLDAKKVTYTEYEITNNSKLSSEAINRSGGHHTVPQIFINGQYVGGYIELTALENSGELDKLLSE